MKLLHLLAIICFTGCHPLFCNWGLGYEQLTTRPANEEIIGKYQLTEKSIDFLEDRDFTADEYSLTLSDGGQFKFKNGPDLIFNSWGTTSQTLLDKQGKWSVSCGDSYDCVIELEGICVVPLAEKDGNLAILITIGDGDECNGIVYEKK